LLKRGKALYRHLCRVLLQHLRIWPSDLFQFRINFWNCTFFAHLLRPLGGRIDISQGACLHGMRTQHVTFSVWHDTCASRSPRSWTFQFRLLILFDSLSLAFQCGWHELKTNLQTIWNEHYLLFCDIIILCLRSVK
jgi:hypothetical protein